MLFTKQLLLVAATASIAQATGHESRDSNSTTSSSHESCDSNSTTSSSHESCDSNPSKALAPRYQDPIPSNAFYTHFTNGKLDIPIKGDHLSLSNQLRRKYRGNQDDYWIEKPFVGDRVTSLIDFEGPTGSLSVDDIGTVQGPADDGSRWTTTYGGKLLVEFDTGYLLNIHLNDISNNDDNQCIVTAWEKTFCHEKTIRALDAEATDDRTLKKFLINMRSAHEKVKDFMEELEAYAVFLRQPDVRKEIERNCLVPESRFTFYSIRICSNSQVGVSLEFFPFGMIPTDESVDATDWWDQPSQYYYNGGMRDQNQSGMTETQKQTFLTGPDFSEEHTLSTKDVKQHKKKFGKAVRQHIKTDRRLSVLLKSVLNTRKTTRRCWAVARYLFCVGILGVGYYILGGDFYLRQLLK